MKQKGFTEMDGDQKEMEEDENEHQAIYTLYVCRFSMAQLKTASRPMGMVTFWSGSRNLGRSAIELRTSSVYGLDNQQQQRLETDCSCW